MEQLPEVFGFERAIAAAVFLIDRQNLPRKRVHRVENPIYVGIAALGSVIRIAVTMVIVYREPEQKQQTAAVFLSQPAVAKKTVHGILRVLYMKRSTVADFMHRQPAVARRDEAGRLRFHGTHALSYSAGKEVIIRFVSFVLVLAHVDAVFLYESRNGKF